MRTLICRAIAWHQTRDRGATAVEYALMVSLIAVVIIASVGLLGEGLVAKFEAITTGIANAGG